VGDDAFGRLLIETLAGYGVATGGVIRTNAAPTGLAVVTVDAAGDREFMFYRTGGADSTYMAAEVDEDAIRAARVLHVGSLMLAEPHPASAQRQAVAVAQGHAVTISADVNLRPSLWSDPDDMRLAALETVRAANILKISDEELTFLTDCTDRAQAVRLLWHPGLRAVAVTLGPAGAEVFTELLQVAVPGYHVPVVDTVGCGDAFMACLLTDLARSDFDLATEATLARLARRACAAGAIAAMGAGAMESLPSAERLAAFLDSHPA
jgi:fructokinase